MNREAYIDSLPLCVRNECWGYLSVQDLGRLGCCSRVLSTELTDDSIWERLYPRTFTKTKERVHARGMNLGHQINRPYRRECIGWSVSVQQLSEDQVWLTGLILDHRNDMFLVRYDLDDREVWEKETITSGLWHTQGKLRIRFLAPPAKDHQMVRAPSVGKHGLEEDHFSFPKPNNISKKRKIRSRSLDSLETMVSLSGDDDYLFSTSPAASPSSGHCVDEHRCAVQGELTGCHSWRCESFRDRSRAPTKLVHQIKDHDDEVLCVAFSHSGNKLASCSRDGSTRIYFFDPNSPPVPFLTIPSSDGSVPCRVIWSPDDSHILICTEAKNGNIFDYDANVACYNVSSGEQLFTKPNIPFDVCASWIPNENGHNIFIHGESLTVSPRGTYHQVLAVHDCGTNKVIGRFYFRFVSEAFIHLIQVSPDGNLLAVSCGLGDGLSDTVRVVRVPKILDPTTTSFEIRVPRSKFGLDNLGVNDFLTSNNSRMKSLPLSKLVSIAGPSCDNDNVVPSFFCGGAVLGLSWSRDSQRFYTNTRPYVRASTFEDVTDRPDLGNTLEVQTWGLIEKGGVACSMRPSTPPLLHSVMSGAHGFTTKDCPFYLFLAESPCGEYIASGSEDCGVYVYHARHGRLMRVLWGGHEDVVSMVSWSGGKLATASDDGKVCVWAGQAA